MLRLIYETDSGKTIHEWNLGNEAIKTQDDCLAFREETRQSD